MIPEVSYKQIHVCVCEWKLDTEIRSCSTNDYKSWKSIDNWPLAWNRGQTELCLWQCLQQVCMMTLPSPFSHNCTNTQLSRPSADQRKWCSTARINLLSQLSSQHGGNTAQALEAVRNRSFSCRDRFCSSAPLPVAALAHIHTPTGDTWDNFTGAAGARSHILYEITCLCKICHDTELFNVTSK